MARKTDTVTISDGRTIPIRQLGWLQLRSSQQAYQRDTARTLVDMGGAEFMAVWKAIQANKGQPPPASEQAQPVEPEADVLSGHNLFTVLTCGIPSLTKDQIEDLDEADAVLLGRRILALTPPARTEADLGNVPAPSTGA